jgi:hypothetical protein
MNLSYDLLTWNDIPEGGKVLPAIICHECGTANPVGWIENCSGCRTTLGKGEMQLDINDPTQKFPVITDPDMIRDYENSWVCKAPYGNNGGTCDCLNLGSSTVCSNAGCSSLKSDFGSRLSDRILPENDSSPEFVTGQSLAVAPRVKLESSFGSTGRNPKQSNFVTSIGRRVRLIANPKDFLKSDTAKVVLAVAGLVLVVQQGFYWLAPTTVTGNVESVSWTSRVELQRLTPVSGSDWSTPIGAYNITSAPRLHHTDVEKIGEKPVKVNSTKQILDGKEPYNCNKSKGTVVTKETCYKDKYKTVPTVETKMVPITKDVPVYKPYYSYYKDEWRTFDTYSSSGADFSVESPSYIVPRGAKANKTCSATLVASSGYGKKSIATNCEYLPGFAFGKSISFQMTRIGWNFGASN